MAPRATQTVPPYPTAPPPRCWLHKCARFLHAAGIIGNNHRNLLRSRIDCARLPDAWPPGVPFLKFLEDYRKKEEKDNKKEEEQQKDHEKKEEEDHKKEEEEDNKKEEEEDNKKEEEQQKNHKKEEKKDEEKEEKQKSAKDDQNGEEEEDKNKKEEEPKKKGPKPKPTAFDPKDKKAAALLQEWQEKKLGVQGIFFVIHSIRAVLQFIQFSPFS